MLGNKKLHELESIFWQLGFGYGAGLGLVDLLESIKKGLSHKATLALLDSMQLALRRGDSLASAVRQHRRLCGNLVVSLFDIAERSGRMQEVCKLCARELGSKRDFYKQLTKAMLYPCFLLVAVLGVFVIIALFVLPEFASLYEDLGANLSLSASLLLDLSDFLGLYYFQILLLAVAALFVLGLAFRPRRLRDRILFYLPVIRSVLLDYEFYRYFLGLHYFLRSGMPLEEGLGLCGDLVSNIYLRHELSFALDSLKRGLPLSACLGELNLQIENLGLLASAEKSGALDGALEFISEFYRRRYEGRLQYMAMIAEPLATFFIGLFVAWIAFATVSPMWDLLLVV